MAEGREKFSEFTDMSGDNGHSSSGSSRRSPGGCYISTVTGFVLVLLAIAIAVGIGIIVNFAGARNPIVECNCNYPNNAGNVNSQIGDDKTTMVPKETTSSDNEFATQCEAYFEQHMEWCKYTRIYFTLGISCFILILLLYCTVFAVRLLCQS